MRGTLAPRSTRRRPFDPRSIPGCVGWFDANDVGAQIADNTVVDTWRDKSGGGRDLTQAGTLRPLLKFDIQNGLSVVRFDGGNDYMSSSAAGLGDLVSGSDLPASLFVAVAPAAVSASQTIAGWFDAAANGNLRLGSNNTPKWLVIKLDDAAATKNSASTGAASAAWHIVSISVVGTTVDMMVDGVTSFSGTDIDIGTTTTTRFAVGARANLTPAFQIAADVGEVLVYNRYLDAAEQARVHKYLGRKWGVFL